ncbi:MAG TPA: DUF2268 domain-containing putative Zn-dependent protease [Flavisolibacter sp.]|nr:DUF2268 domain-containing putative Zn-dependent protease [Flavisolibacter sp.]
MRNYTLLLALLLSGATFAQNRQKLAFNKTYSNFQFGNNSQLHYTLPMEKDGYYEVAVLQQGVDVVISLSDRNNKQLAEKDSPNGTKGYEKLTLSAESAGDYTLTVKRLEDGSRSDTGMFSIHITQFPKAEALRRAKIQKEMAAENAKHVQTADIDHFWEAFDKLKACKTHADSVNTIQQVYLDRATSGLTDFIAVRQNQFTAEEFVATIAMVPKFYTSIRKNTYEVKKAEPLIEEIFQKFKEIYPKFQPFKVCFAIGTLGTGGTLTNKFVLIGTEITTSTKDADLSEFKGNNFSKVLAGEEDIVQKIKNIVAHECVHTQQNTPQDPNAIDCSLLSAIIHEGSCDFIGEILAGSQINKVAQSYGDAHEKELWQALKNELCNTSVSNWLYNGRTVKDKPADLGYYMGYKIAQAYYKNAADKKQAIIDIIEMNNPIRFLELSKYDQQPKN